MRFGLFIPQGWRQDLTGIDPHDHWQVMSGLARHADEGDAYESIWVYDHFHSVPEPNGEATHEAWSLINAFAASISRRHPDTPSAHVVGPVPCGPCASDSSSLRAGGRTSQASILATTGR